MTAIQNFFQNLLYQIPKIGISDIIDILVVSFLIYTVLRLVRSSSAARVAWTVLVLLIATWLTSVFDLYACNWILNKILELGFISLVVIFQPEIRRAMERFGGKFFLNRGNGFLRGRRRTAGGKREQDQESQHCCQQSSHKAPPGA